MHRIVILIYILLITNIAFSDCDGVAVDFLKSPYADWTLAENQDSLAPTVKITRKDNQSLFNIAQEEGYSGNNGSPVGTLWANSATQDATADDYTSFVSMHGGNPTSLIGTTISLYLPGYELYYDLQFTSFSSGNTGGGFGWTRTCVAELNVENHTINSFELEPAFPNPFNPTTQISFSLEQYGSVNAAIYDLTGTTIETLIEGNLQSGRHSIQWDASNISSGIYILRLNSENMTQTQKLIFLK